MPSPTSIDSAEVSAIAPHQSHIEHEEFEGVQVFIEFEREAWVLTFILTAYASPASISHWMASSMSAALGLFFHGSIDELLVLFWQVGQGYCPTPY